MPSLNKVMLIATLGKDPDLRYTASGQAVASFSAATSEKFKNKAGELEERTEWHNITVWGKLAEISKEYLAKGKLVYVEGRIQTRKWQDKSGNDRYTTEIIGDKIQLLSSKGKVAEGEREGSNQRADDTPPYQDDDIPF